MTPSEAALPKASLLCRMQYSPDQRAFTLVEMLIAILLIGLVLFMAIGWTRSVRLAARRELAIDVLARLNTALDRYHRARGDDPPESDERAADAATTALLQLPVSRKVTSEIPTRL